MLGGQYCSRSGNEHDGLGVVDDHCWTLDHVSNLQRRQQVYGGIFDAAYLVEIHAVSCVSLLSVYRLLCQFGHLGVHRLAECVECLANSSDLIPR